MLTRNLFTVGLYMHCTAPPVITGICLDTYLGHWIIYRNFAKRLTHHLFIFFRPSVSRLSTCHMSSDGH